MPNENDETQLTEEDLEKAGGLTSELKQYRLWYLEQRAKNPAGKITRKVHFTGKHAKELRATHQKEFDRQLFLILLEKALRKALKSPGFKALVSQLVSSMISSAPIQKKRKGARSFEEKVDSKALKGLLLSWLEEPKVFYGEKFDEDIAAVQVAEQQDKLRRKPMTLRGEET